MKRLGVFVSIIVFCFILSGCATQKGWHYNVEQKKDRKPILNETVAVPVFKDARADKNNNSFAMYLIPLFPFGWADYTIPEGGGAKLNSTPIWLFKPNEDLAKAAAEELEASSLFKEVFFTQRASEGELTFLGTINSTNYSATMISYGLSAYGPLLWAFGLPCGSIHNQLGVEFKLTDRKNAVLWQNSYTLKYDKSPVWIYSLPSDFQYDSMYKEIMLKVVVDLENKLKKSEQ